MRKLILQNGYSPGDVVMMTAAVRDLHLCYPNQFVTDVRTNCPELWENNPYVTPLPEDDPGIKAVDCKYPLIDHSNELPYHCLHGYAHFLNDTLGLAIKPTSFKGDIHLSALEMAWASQVHELTGQDTPFWIIAAGGKYDISIKWWARERYQEVVDHFRGKIQFVQVGEAGHHHPKLEGVIDLRGQTTLRQLVRLVYHSQGILCGVTSLMHLAAAVPVKGNTWTNRPCVVVAGGREPAHWEAYPDHQFIHTNGALRCCSGGGCWRERVIPLGDGDERDAPDRLCVDVVGRLPRCMHMITAAEVIRRIETYVHGGRIRYLTPKQWQAAQHGVVTTANNPFDNQTLNLHTAGPACEEFIRTIPEYSGEYQGRGIVICGGGAKYFTNAWICIHMLRQLGCQLPIELWYLGQREMDKRMRALVAPLNVLAVDATRVRKYHPVRILRGWELKPYAILHSRFREVLLLDADNVPVKNPEFLFETPKFQDTGAIFWPDYHHQEKADVIWRSCGLTRPEGPEFETGQIVVDKERCWRALKLSMWFNENSDFYYQYLHGDKETFHLAFCKLNKSFSFIAKPIHTLDGAMCQHDFDGWRLFQHRNTAKWNLLAPNENVEDFWFERECRRYLQRLRKLWDGSPVRPRPGRKPKK